MKKRSAGAVWGILMILGGVLLAGRILHWFEFDLFFRGWWTLFLIIPSAVNFLTGQRNRSASLKGLIIGALLLMAAQGFIEYRMFFPLLIAAFLIMSGCRMMFCGGKKKNRRSKERAKRRAEGRTAGNRGNTASGNRENMAAGSRGNTASENWENTAAGNWQNTAEGSWGGAEDNAEYEDASRYSYEEEYDYYADETPGGGFGWNEYANREEYRRENRGQRRRDDFSENMAGGAYGNRAYRNGRCACTAVFMGKEIDFSGEVFEGAVLSSVMGAIDLNLSGAILYHDVTVEAIAVLGGIDIIAPQNARVVVEGKPLFGSIDQHLKRKEAPADAPVVYVKATCIMGGIDIR